MADNGNGVFSMKSKKPPKSAGDTVKSFIWNSETGEFCGRTGMSWFKITAFYLVFFSCLALFFVSMFWLFWQTMDAERPKWIGDNGLIGSNPGVGFRPMPDQDKNPESTLIWINKKQEMTKSYWATQLNDFFDKNYIQKEGPNANCSFNEDANPDANPPCDVQLEAGACNKADNYGYTNGAGTPCVLVKLNKIFDWRPEPYLPADEELARKNNMPDHLIQKIKELGGESATEEMKRQLQTTWISCEGENPADRENIGPIEYYAPGQKGQFQGIPNYYFPYTMQKSYKSPFIFVKFTKPATNVLIQIECKAWAKNIIADRFLRLGSVHFEIMLDAE